MVRSPRCFCQVESVVDEVGNNVCSRGKCSYKFAGSAAPRPGGQAQGSMTTREPALSESWKRQYRVHAQAGPLGTPVSGGRGVKSGSPLGRGSSGRAQNGHVGTVAPSEEVSLFCECQEAMPAARRVSHTAKNPNRAFWTCSKSRDALDRCSYFQWEDEIASKEKGSEHDFAPPSEKWSPSKRPRSAYQAGSGSVKFSLEEVGSLSAVVSTKKLPGGIIENLRKMEGVSILRTGQVDIRGESIYKVTLPIAGFEAARAMARVKDVVFDCALPASVFSRLLRFQEVEAQRKASRREVTQGLDEILPAAMCEKLMEFQWEGIHFALRRDGRCLIGDDMGLGKTLQAIAIARIFRRDWPLLIICPSSLRLNWKEELLMWLGEDIDEDDINVIMKGTDCKRPFALVNIASYELVQKTDERQVRKCGFVIADESHYVKSMDTKRSKFVVPLIRRMSRALLLSGTPALSRPVELFPQINALEPELFPNYHEFTERYCDAKQGNWGWDVSGSSNLNELHTVLRGSCLIRRKKEDVLTQLPAKQRGVVWVETNAKVMKLVKEAQLEFEEAKEAVQMANTEEEMGICRNEVRGAQNKLYSLTGRAKVAAVQQFLKETMDSMPRGKILVFGHHSEVLLELDEFVKRKMKMDTIVIDGKTQQGLRQGLCKKFQTDPKCRVAMLSITAAGVGLTLTAASVVVFAELYWTPGSLMQAEDRAHRIGQKDCVMVKYLLARDTLDESIWRAVKSKLKVVDQSLTGQATNLAVSGEGAEEHDPTAGIERFLKMGGPVEEIDEDGEMDERNVSRGDAIPGPKVQGRSLQRSQSPRARLPDPAFSKAEPTGRDCGDGVIALDEDEEIFPTEVVVVDEDEPGPRCRRPLLDADLALAKKLQEEFDAEVITL